MPIAKSVRLIAHLAIALASYTLWMSSCTIAAENIHERTSTRVRNEDLSNWLMKESQKCKKGIFQNISPFDSKKGVVVASPSKKDPDYYFHWVRDAALVMDVVVDLYRSSENNADRNTLASQLEDFVYFSKQNQETPNRSNGLGEPKFHVDGSAFNGEWGRPQNDGPALRAITLIRYAKLLLTDGSKEDWVQSHLYDGTLPTQSVIKKDLEFVSHHWREVSFDLWEETRGQHFYTRIVQRRSLLDGADLADQLGDYGAGQWYRQQAQLLEAEIEKHWDGNRGYILATLDHQGGNPFKATNLDVAVILASLHGDRKDGFFGPSHEKILASAYKIREAFQQLYDINKNNRNLGVAIGRYPEDVYDGYALGVSAGNPWVLATAAFAELCYRVISEWRNSDQISITSINLPFVRLIADGKIPSHQLVAGAKILKGSNEFKILLNRLKEEGDQYLRRIMFHTPEDGSLSEQINRTTGYMQGAHDLTWSYSSILTAYWLRPESLLE